MSNDVERRYHEAVDSVTNKLKKDPNILAVILLGSLSYDRVWEKSDVDMTAVVRDDQKLPGYEYCIDEDDIVINLAMVTRTDFVKMMNKSIEGLIGHSINSRGKILYTRDESLHDYFSDTGKIGKSDMELASFFIAEGIVAYMQKAEKWIRVKNDETYARYYVLKMVHEIARLAVCLHGESPSREAILRAAELEPELMERFYYYPMNNVMSRDEVLELIKAADEYLCGHMDTISKPISEYLSDGEPKTVTAISKHFRFGGHGLTHITEYFKEKGVVDKTTETIRVTPKGRPVVEEIAYIYVKEDF